MSSLAYPTIGKEYHDTNYAHDWFLKSTTYLSELFPFFGEFWAESWAQFNAKGIENLLFEHLLVKSIWGYIGKSNLFYFFVSVHEIEESWLYCLVFLCFVGIDNPRN